MTINPSTYKCDYKGCAKAAVTYEQATTLRWYLIVRQKMQWISIGKWGELPAFFTEARHACSQQHALEVVSDWLIEL